MDQHFIGLELGAADRARDENDDRGRKHDHDRNIFAQHLLSSTKRLPLRFNSNRMDESIQSQNRRSRRSHVLMAAVLRTEDGDLSVKLRNLSENGALVEAQTLPPSGSTVRFRKGELNLAARVAWVEDGRAGVAFDSPLDTESVMRHIPVPQVPRKLDFRRPPIKSQQLSAGERKIAEDWIFGRPSPGIAD
ncbi:MAG: PilZ domain-containing protein [Sphingomicrobium sp.]